MDIANLAIQASVHQDWTKAIKLNQEIIKQDQVNTDALNRLARAFLETNQKTKAETTYKKVLKIDKYNHIAQKGLDQIKTFKPSQINPHPLPPGTTSVPLFLEEPGTTKTISLTRLGDPQILRQMHSGDSVILAAREHCVSVINLQNQYLGRLPDDLASRLGKFIKNGSKFTAWVKSVEYHSLHKLLGLKIFIKESYRCKKYKDVLPFPLTEKLSYAAFTPPELVHVERPNVSTTEEDQPEDLPESFDLESPESPANETHSN